MRLIKSATTPRVHLKHVLFRVSICHKSEIQNNVQVKTGIRSNPLRSYSQLGLMSLTARSDAVLSSASNGWNTPPAGQWILDGFARRLLDESAGSPRGFSETPMGPLILNGCDYSAPPDEPLPPTVMTDHLSMCGSVIASPDASWLNSQLDQGDSFRC
jgi:hypothetical protein